MKLVLLQFIRKQTLSPLQKVRKLVIIISGCNKNIYRESFKWYRNHPDEVKKKAYIQFINEHFE